MVEHNDKDQKGPQSKEDAKETDLKRIPFDEAVKEPVSQTESANMGAII